MIRVWIVLSLFLTISLFAEEKSCYTVQLVSAYKTEKNLYDLEKKEYDSSCKIMSIGSNIVVRCGCFDGFTKASEHKEKYINNYPDAYVRTTYRSRFSTGSSVDAPKKTTPKKVVPIAAPVVVAPPVVTEVIADVLPVSPILQQEKKIKKKKKSKVKKKKTSKKKKHKKHKKKHKKKKHKKKKNKKSKSKSKVKKSKAKKFKYNRYLKRLQSRRAQGKYKYKYKFGAQISYDFGYINEADNSYFASDFRRVRVYHKGSFFREKLFYELEYSFTGSNNFKDNLVGYQDRSKELSLSYRFQAGNIKIPFSLERYTSSKNNTFMERALNDAYGESRKLGGEILLHKKFSKEDSLNVFGALFSNSIDERIARDVSKPGYSMRLTYAHRWNKHHLLSVGGAYFAQNMNGDNIKFNDTAESFVMKEKYISASVKKVDTLAKQNLELLYIYNKYSLQAEYTRVGVHAINKSNTNTFTDYTFSGYYLQGSYFLIGEGRRYKSATSTMKKPRLSKKGAVEVAMRYSYINLNDKDEDKNGEQSDYNFGLNYYFNDEIKLMVNYIIAQPSQTKLYDGRMQLLQSRLLFAF